MTVSSMHLCTMKNIGYIFYFGFLPFVWQTFSKSHFAAKVSLSPSLKPVNVPEELRKEYGDLLMITEFVYFYGKFLSQDRDIVHTPGEEEITRVI